VLGRTGAQCLSDDPMNLGHTRFTAHVIHLREQLIGVGEPATREKFCDAPVIAKLNCQRRSG